MLAVESYLHNRHIRRIQVRISVTGTRGKTSTARMLAGMLKQAGFRVITKTTGTEACYLMPDGEIVPVKRKPGPNIIEQKKLVRMASAIKADILIAEQMSIHPENHRTETQKLIQPGYTILTNTWPDHLEAAGDDMKNLYLNDIRKGAKIIVPSSEASAELEEDINRKGASIIRVEKGNGPESNFLLAARLAEELGCTKEQIQKGSQEFSMDKGSLSAYKYEVREYPVIFINAFAANDPLSGEIIIKKISGASCFRGFNIYCLLSFRKDRGDRSLQWRDFLIEPGRDLFHHCFFIGEHGRIVRKTLGKGDHIRQSDPEGISSHIIRKCAGPSLVFGLGNIGGTGLRLIDYWNATGHETDLTNLMK